MQEQECFSSYSDIENTDTVASNYTKFPKWSTSKFLSMWICTLQPKFLLAEGFAYCGHKERAIYYIADFKYLMVQSDEWVVEDVKGTRTEVYKLKRKLFLAKYGYMYDFQEVAA